MSDYTYAVSPRVMTTLPGTNVRILLDRDENTLVHYSINEHPYPAGEVVEVKIYQNSGQTIPFSEES